LNQFLAFITGLTTGGLSCLAVQGGLLASSLANQVEQDVLAAGKAAKGSKGRSASRQANPAIALPILLFLSAKLVTYTLMGLLLGAAGSMFQLSPYARAFLQIAIGIYMVGAALRMLNVHPIFRFFVFEPPAFLRRKIRKTAAAGNASLMTPLFLGFMTILIPCGITQAMMAVALGTGSALQGAALMFAFTLGTSPVFFAVAYFATKLGSRLEKYFMTFVAVVLLVLGLVAVDTGLNLAGSPVSVTRLINGLSSASTVQAGNSSPLQTVELPAPASSGEVASDNVVTVKVQNGGYFPDKVYAKAGQPIQLRLVSSDVYTCALSFVIPSLGVQKDLQPTDEVLIDIPAQKAGTTIPFSCSMGMFTGKLVVQ
jgi:sulfite exporter TauE/SafE